MKKLIKFYVASARKVLATLCFEILKELCFVTIWKVAAFSQELIH